MLYDSEFTKLYALSKTLRFELKPVGKTFEYITQNKILERDKERDDNYHKVKYYFDLLHRQFIEDALSKVNLDYSNYLETLVNASLTKDAKDKKLKEIEADLRKRLAISFDDTAKLWKEHYNKKWEIEAKSKSKKENAKQLKKDGINILFEDNNLYILDDLFKDGDQKDGSAPKIVYTKQSKNGLDEKVNIFESFKGFHTYFDKFNESRKNFYSEKAQTTAISNRAINENLAKYCQNILTFEKYRNKYQGIGITVDVNGCFIINNYNNYLKQPGIDNYNETLAELNKKVNLYRQQTKDKALPYFKYLYNQILSEKKLQTKYIEILSDNDVYKILSDFIELNEKQIDFAKDLMENFYNNNEEYDLSKIYIGNKPAINTISNKWFINWGILLSLVLPKGRKELDNLSLSSLQGALTKVSDPKNENYIETGNLFKSDYHDLILNNYFGTFLKIYYTEFQKNIDVYNGALKDLITTIENTKIYNKNEATIEVIKNYADSALSIYQMLKYFVLKNDSNTLESDGGFYNKLDQFFDNYQIIDYYNELRNYLSKKDYLNRLKYPSFTGDREYKDERAKRKTDTAEKIKINFDKGSLLGGWAESPEGNAQYSGYILRKDGKYYLAVTDNTTILDRKKHPEIARIDGGHYEKMTYKQLKAQTIYGSRYEARYKNAYKNDKDILSEKELINNVKKLLTDQLDLYPELKGIVETEYVDPKILAKDISNLMLYTVSFDEKISCEYVDMVIHKFEKSIEPKFLYLFEIYSKDFSEKTLGNPNLHTEYFKNLFTSENLTKPTFKLSGGAEIFFRPFNESLHKAPIDRLIQNSGKTIKVIEKKRYTLDKWFLHIPIILNMGTSKYEKSKAFNLLTNNKIKSTNDINIIGIDRGEKHLAYYSVINNKGEIIDSGSLNTISQISADGSNRDVNYIKKLEEKAGNRDIARKSWQTIENIKELKKGYISNVVKIIADKMIEHNAVLVLEDLNKGFKRGRFKIEKQVYQNLELALSKKLNYLVNKTANLNEPGHYLNAYQLTPLTSNFKDIYSQNGSIFYTTAGYTSKTCPRCGFRPTIYDKYQNEKQAIEFIKKFDEIKYDSKTNSIKFTYKPSKFGKPDDKLDIYQGKIDVYTNVIRHVGKKDNHGKWLTLKIDVNKEFIDLLSSDKYNIDIKSNIKENLLKNSEKLDKNFYERFIWLFRLVMQIRNSYKEDNIDKDVITCPSCGFDSDKPPRELSAIVNGDANGAYNIARKGLIIINKIKSTNDLTKLQYKDLYIDNKTWDEFVRE